MINGIFSQKLTVEQKSLAVLQLAKARGLSADQLANQSFLTADDIAQGQELSNFRL